MEGTEWIEEKWHDEYKGVLLSQAFRSFAVEKMNRQYSGTVEIELMGLISSGHIVGRELTTLLQPYGKRVHGSLPSAELEVRILLTDMSHEVVQAAQLLLDLTEKMDWASFTRQRLSKLKEEFEKHKSGALVRSEVTKEDLDKLSHLIAGVGAIDGSETSEADLWNTLDALIPVIAGLPELGRNPDRDFRSRAAQCLEALKKSDPILSQVDIEALHAFASDLFLIFKHFMNLVIRYFKHSHQQTWLREIQLDDLGYFYSRNEVLLDNRGPFLPLVRHRGNLVKLGNEFVIKRKDWSSPASSTLNRESIEAISNPFRSIALEGMFSHAFQAIEESHLEDAAILGIAGLETAMRQTLDYFGVERRNLPGVVSGVKRLFEASEAAPRAPVSVANLWRLIEGKPTSPRNPRKYGGYEDGLIPIRHKSTHRRHKFRIDKRKTKRVGEFMNAARQMAYLLEAWLDTNPSKDIVRQLKAAKKKPKKKH